MSNYISDYSGSQINNVIGLFHGKGLDQVTGLVQRNADGSFSQGSGGGGSDVFIATPNVTTYNELLAAIQAGKYLCIHVYDDYENTLSWIQFAEKYGDNIYLRYFTNNARLVYKVTSSNVWSIDSNYIILTENSTLSASKLSGAIPASVTATTQSSGDNSTKIATTAYVDGAISNLPEPMIFKGSLGTGGTITTLPTAASTNKGFTYKVITDGTYASQAAKVGDTFISDGTAWVLIPSGDEPSGTVTSIVTGSGLTGGPITSSGTISLDTAFGDIVNPYGSKTANYVLAAPNGQAGVPTFRALVAEDLPNGNWLNGSATGSVRTSGSAVESSNYIIGNYAVAEGYNTKASGISSHAEGSDTIASGDYSHAQNYFTEAEYDYQTVIGKYNDNKSTSAFEIGNGSSNNNRSNALAVDWKGNINTNNTDIVRDTPPSADQWIERIALNDASGELIGAIRTPFKRNGDEGIQFETCRTINGGSVFNGFGLWVASDGTPLVTINQPNAWRAALGLDSFIITDDFTIDNITIAANSFSGAQTKNVSKNGYTPLMIQISLANASSNGKNVTGCSCYTQTLSGNTVSCYIANRFTSEAKVKAVIKVLYKAN